LDKRWEDCAEGNLVSSHCMDHSLGKDLNNFKLKCMSTNARSITNRFVEFQVFIGQQLPHVVAITESWCFKSISNAEIHLKSYNLYRFDKHVLLVEGFFVRV